MMNSDSKKKLPPKPKLLSSGLPASPDDVPSVTTEQGSRTARSVGGVAAMTPPPFGSGPMSPGDLCPPPSYGSLRSAQVPTMPSKIRATSGASGVSSISSYESLTPGRDSLKSTFSAGVPQVEVSTKTSSSGGFGWNFRDVPTLPDFHPLERTAVFVPNASAPEVAERVSSVLRERSIASTFNDAKAKAKCVTEEGVEFRVRLYRGKPPKHDHGIIVEVQRRYGFSHKFHADTTSILDAAEGKTSTLPPPVENYVPLVSDVEEEDDETDDFDSETSSGSLKRKEPSSLSIASDMLKRSRTVDANVLALESLASLTDPARMGRTTALRVSSQILSSIEEGEGGNEVRDAVISLIVDGKLKEESSASDAILQDDEQTFLLRHLATTILTNAISVVSESRSEKARQTLRAQSSLLTSEVVPALVTDVRDADSSPQVAAAAARCLRAVVSCDAPEVGSKAADAAREDGVLEALARARDLGRAGHASLEEAASGCLDAVDSR